MSTEDDDRNHMVWQESHLIFYGKIDRNHTPLFASSSSVDRNPFMIWDIVRY